MAKTYRDSFREKPFFKADWESRLLTWAALLMPSCQRCNRQNGHSQPSASFQPGTVAFFPRENQISQDSIVRLQAAVNDGAYGHPALILLNSPCGHNVFSAPVTSLSDRGILAKYANISSQSSWENIMWRYLSIHQPMQAHSDLQWLETMGQDTMDKTSYMHLDHGFWIEKDSLRPLSRTKNIALTGHSLNYAQWAYSSAEEHRANIGSPSSSPSMRPLTPPYDVSFPALSPATNGVYLPNTPPGSPCTWNLSRPMVPSSAPSLNPLAPSFGVSFPALPPATNDVYLPNTSPGSPCDWNLSRPMVPVPAPSAPLGPWGCSLQSGFPTMSQALPSPPPSPTKGRKFEIMAQNSWR